MSKLHQEGGKDRIVSRKNNLLFDMVIDHNQVLTKKLETTITPEVMVYNEDKEEIIYKGRIEDSYFRVGKRKQVKTTSELEDVQNTIINDEAVHVESQKRLAAIFEKNKT